MSQFTDALKAAVAAVKADALDTYTKLKTLTITEAVLTLIAVYILAAVIPFIAVVFFAMKLYTYIKSLKTTTVATPVAVPVAPVVTIIPHAAPVSTVPGVV